MGNTQRTLDFDDAAASAAARTSGPSRAARPEDMTGSAAPLRRAASRPDELRPAAEHTFAEQDAPRLSEAQRLRMAEGVLVELRKLKLRVDEFRRDHRGAPWTEIWGRTFSAYATPEELRDALRLAPGDRLDEFLGLHRGEPGAFWTMLGIARRAKVHRLRCARDGRPIPGYGVDAIAVIMRWEMDERGETPRDGEDWKVNNNWRSYYARLLALFDPELADLFEVRTSK